MSYYAVKKFLGKLSETNDPGAEAMSVVASVKEFLEKATELFSHGANKDNIFEIKYSFMNENEYKKLQFDKVDSSKRNDILPPTSLIYSSIHHRSPEMIAEDLYRKTECKRLHHKVGDTMCFWFEKDIALSDEFSFDTFKNDHLKTEYYQ